MATTEELLSAVDAGDRAQVSEILARDPSVAASRDSDGVSATLHALYRGQPVIAELLAEAVPELDIFEAASLSRAERVRELLDAEPARARAFSPDGFTALHYPGFLGGQEAALTAQAPIAARADVNARSTNDFSV